MESFIPDYQKPESSQADVDLIVRELGGGRSQEEVCRMLCMQRGYEWVNAQSLIAQVASQSRTRIARRQAPFLIFLGVVTLIGGVLMLTRSTYLFLHYNNIHTLGSTRSMIGGFGLGFVMTVGSAVGLAKAVIAMWK